MDVREKLVELLDEAEEWADCKCDELGCESCPADKMKGDCVQQLMVDRLIAHGVTVQQLDGCFRCKDSQKMTVTISNKLIDAVNIGWLGGNLPARYCPFCGRRLSQPPKGEWL